MLMDQLINNKMGVSDDYGKMEGWLYLIRSNTFGFQFSRKRFFLLQHHLLKTFKSSSHKDPIRTAAIGSCIAVIDNGKKSIRGKVFFVFTVCNTCNGDDFVKLGAKSPEEAGAWIRSIRESARKVQSSSSCLQTCNKLNYSNRVRGTSCWTRSRTTRTLKRLVASNKSFRTKSTSDYLSSKSTKGAIVSEVVVSRRIESVEAQKEGGNGETRKRDSECEFFDARSHYSSSRSLGQDHGLFFDARSYYSSSRSLGQDHGLFFDAHSYYSSSRSLGLNHGSLDELLIDFSNSISLNDEEGEDDGGGGRNRILDSSNNYACGILPKDPNGKLPNSWSSSNPSLFQIRGATFFKDGKKVSAQGSWMQSVTVEWHRSNKREDDIASRPRSIVQKFANSGRKEFFFVVNLQTPSSPQHSLGLYFMTSTPIEDIPLLKRFVEGDDAFRNSRIKMISYASEGPWIVKRTIVNKAVLIGKVLKVNYIRGSNYLELDVNLGSSALARSMGSLAFRYFSYLVFEFAFLIQANMPEELPENLIGVCRLNYPDLDKAVWA